MVFVAVIVLGVIIFVIGNVMLEEYTDNNFTISMVLCLIGFALIMFGMFMTRPLQSKASELSVEPRVTNNCRMVSGAGITAHMNALRYAYMNEPELMTTEGEIDLLARLMTAEQGYNADEEDYYLTGSVVINRIKSNSFPNSMYEVIYQSNPDQYQCISNGSINREYDEVAWEIAEELLTYGTSINERVVYQAEFEQGSEIYTQRGNTYYCYE